MADEPKITFKEDLDDEKEPFIFEPPSDSVPLDASTSASTDPIPVAASTALAPVPALESAKVPYKYDLRNFYKEKNREVKVSSDGADLKKFYKAKAKDGKGTTYGYDADGNLVVREKETVVKTIALPTYRPPTIEEIKIMEEQHEEAIALANRAVDDARTALYQMSQSVERDDSTMLRLNRMVMEADCKLCMARFPLMYIAKEDGIKIRQLDFTQPTETRGLPYDVAIIQTRPFPLQEQYVRIGEPAIAPLVSVAEAKSMMKADVPIVVFEGADSNEYGYLSMEWAVVLEYNSITYHSVYQAIYCELAKSFDDQDHFEEFLAVKKAEEINYTVEDTLGNLEQNREKWNERIRKLIYEVNLAKFRRYPELAAKLLETKNAMIGAYEPGDRLIGIGIPLESIDSKDPANWGENVLGKALMNIRDILRSEQPVKQSRPRASSAIGKKPSRAPASVPAPVPASVPAPVAASAPIASVVAPASESAIPSMAIAKRPKPSRAPASASASAPVPVSAPIAAPAPVEAPAPIPASVPASVGRKKPVRAASRAAPPE